MEAYIANIMEFPIHYNVKERISSMRFSPLFFERFEILFIIDEINKPI